MKNFKQNKISTLLVAITLFSFVLITNNSNAQAVRKGSKVVKGVITKKQQDALTADTVIKSFKEGNARYMKNQLTPRDLPAQIRKSTNGQYPEAIVLTCVDSRVPVEYIFDKGIGDIFVARVAGNVIDVDVLGSMEYACKVAGSKLVLVMGHEHCGAVKSAVKDVTIGNITGLLSKIRPVVNMESKKFKGDTSYKNAKFVHEVEKNNVLNSVKEIREKSSILREMEKKGEIKIVGALYSLEDGKVSYLN